MKKTTAVIELEKYVKRWNENPYKKNIRCDILCLFGGVNDRIVYVSYMPYPESIKNPVFYSYKFLVDENDHISLKNYKFISTYYIKKKKSVYNPRLPEYKGMIKKK